MTHTRVWYPTYRFLTDLYALRLHPRSMCLLMASSAVSVIRFKHGDGDVNDSYLVQNSKNLGDDVGDGHWPPCMYSISPKCHQHLSKWTYWEPLLMRPLLGHFSNKVDKLLREQLFLSTNIYVFPKKIDTDMRPVLIQDSSICFGHKVGYACPSFSESKCQTFL